MLTFIFQDSSCHIVSAYVLLHNSCHSIFSVQWAAIDPPRLAFILGLLNSQDFEKVHFLKGKQLTPAEKHVKYQTGANTSKTFAWNFLLFS